MRKKSHLFLSSILEILITLSGCRASGIGEQEAGNTPITKVPTSTATSLRSNVMTQSNSRNNEPAQQSTTTKNSIAPNMHCLTSHLSARRANTDAGVGNFGISYVFTNTSSSTCTLYGYPGFVLLDDKEQPLEGVKVIRSEGTYFQRAEPAQLVTLSPGAQASFQIAYHNATEYQGQSCPKSAKVEITPPNTYNHFILPEHIQLCRGNLKITPVRASVIPV